MLKSMKYLFALPLLAMVACGPETPELPNEEELITTLQLDFRNASSGEVSTFKLYDEDGFGPIEPVYTNGQLEANTNYTVTITVLNETENPADNITAEIAEEAADHQFFFTASNSLNIDFAYDDTDVNNNPVGLSTIFTTGAASEGTLTVVLRHEPAKDAAGVKDGDITNAGGETDIQAVFDVTIN